MPFSSASYAARLGAVTAVRSSVATAALGSGSGSPTTPTWPPVTRPGQLTPTKITREHRRYDVHSIPVSEPVGAVVGAVTRWAVKAYARSEGCSERKAAALGNTAGAAAGALAAHGTSVLLGDPVMATHHAVRFGHHVLTLATGQTPVIDIT